MQKDDLVYVGHMFDMARKAIRKPPGRATSGRIDLTLIRWMARLTPNQRLAVLQDHVNLVSTARRATRTD